MQELQVLNRAEEMGEKKALDTFSTLFRKLLFLPFAT